MDPYVIMVVDDDIISLSTIASSLKEKYQIRPFPSGEKALAYLKAGNVDLVLLDNQMPVMTGLDMLRIMQKDARLRNIPVVMLTGSMEDGPEVEALSLGAVDFIRKPVKPQALMTRVRLHLELLEHRKYLEALVAEKTRTLTVLNEKLKLREDITLSLLARATDMRDHDTGGHLERTTEYVRIMVEDIVERPHGHYRLSREEGNHIIHSAKLHDIGKIAIPDYVLLKPDRLSADEFAIIKEHPIVGANMLNEFIRQLQGDPFLNTARDIVLTHHEYWNGKGYPQGLAAVDIPLSGRIVAVADVYDALASARPYKEPLSHEMSVQIISNGSGTQFDPYLTSVFLRHEKALGRIAACIADLPVERREENIASA